MAALRKYGPRLLVPIHATAIWGRGIIEELVYILYFGIPRFLQQSMNTEDANKVSRADCTALESRHIAVQTGANTAVESAVQSHLFYGCNGRSTKSYLCVARFWSKTGCMEG